MARVGGSMPSSRRQTLPTAARVRKRREFLAVQRAGRRLPARHFLVLEMLAGAGPARLGITVTRKVGNAVERNRVKRAVREAFRRTRSRLADGSALVVIAREGAAALGAVRTARELEPVFARLERAPSSLPASRPSHA